MCVRDGESEGDSVLDLDDLGALDIWITKQVEIRGESKSSAQLYFGPAAKLFLSPHFVCQDMAASSIVLGATFRDYASFNDAFNDYCAKTGYVFRKDGKTVEAANRNIQNPARHFKQEFKYKLVSFECKHFGEYASKGRGIRKRQISNKCDCKAFIKISADRKADALVVRDLCFEHNHPVSFSSPDPSGERKQVFKRIKYHCLMDVAKKRKKMKEAGVQEQDGASGQVHAPNSHLARLEKDVLYHIAMDTETHDFKAMFSDIKFVCFGGSPNRMEKFALHLASELTVPIPTGMTLENLAKGSDRYVVYKVGPVLSISHGMGIPSLSIIFHEVVKLLHYAKSSNVVFLRLGTCGGLGLTPGSVVISKCAVDGALNPHMELVTLGKTCHLPTMLDEALAKELLSLTNASTDGFDTLIGKTMCTLDFYEGQARLDGAFCDYTEKDKMDFLEQVYHDGVRNIEMESLCFAAYCNRAGIPGAVVCVTLVDRLKGDQLTMTHEVMEDWQTRPQRLVIGLMKSRLGLP